MKKILSTLCAGTFTITPLMSVVSCELFSESKDVVLKGTSIFQFPNTFKVHDGDTLTLYNGISPPTLKFYKPDPLATFQEKYNLEEFYKNTESNEWEAFNGFRFFGIDTPELKDPKESPQYIWANQAKEFVVDNISPDFTFYPTDTSYNRIVGIIDDVGLPGFDDVEKSTEKYTVAEKLLRDGLAKTYLSDSWKAPLEHHYGWYIDRLYKAEEYAQQEKHGFWADDVEIKQVFPD